jgi:hypothetical protein
VKKKRSGPQDERRRDQVEINLVGDETGTRKALHKARRGCSLPFTGGLLIVAALALARAALG